MSTASNKTDKDPTELQISVRLILNVIQQFQSPDSSNSVGPDNSTSLNILDLVHDCATLIHAHSVKLSLLLSNKPFTPSVISRVLRELATGPIPSLLYAVELCNSQVNPRLISLEIEHRVKHILAELKSLVEIIPSSRGLLANSLYDGMDTNRNKSLNIVGTIWENCDALKELKYLGIVGIYVKKIVEYRDLIKDALEELREWAMKESDTETDNEEAALPDNDTLQYANEWFSTCSKHIPSQDPDEIRPRLQITLKKLRLLILMFQAIIKRRLNILPGQPNLRQEVPSENYMPILKTVKLLDQLIDHIKKISDLTDDLAGSFYNLDVKQIDQKMKECFLTGSVAVESLVNNWEGNSDNFSTWLLSFQKIIVSENANHELG
ncbi:hypothetical protein GcM3_173022 [Golovinomyces cichoracearum]|uniref:Cyclin-D1-binding protein 1-like N-terminal domain-containing protein n=1 Tax=Golovinomyces cichoracearum TaxID=62708 RepID=A0A420HQ92_9PEZI|nr:hypothetical protein GcM3_173022 [Golovinomyces cichoracearum]